MVCKYLTWTVLQTEEGLSTGQSAAHVSALIDAARRATRDATPLTARFSRAISSPTYMDGPGGASAQQMDILKAHRFSEDCVVGSTDRFAARCRRRLIGALLYSGQQLHQRRRLSSQTVVLTNSPAVVFDQLAPRLINKVGHYLESLIGERFDRVCC